MYEGVHGPQLLKKILESRIDWKEYAERRPDARWWAGAPIPVLRKYSPVYNAVVENSMRILKMFDVMQPEVMATFLYKMQGHFWQPSMSEALAKSVAADYLRLLKGYGVGIFSEMYDEIICESGRKFCPTIGELKGMLDKKTVEKNILLGQLNKLLEKAQ